MPAQPWSYTKAGKGPLPWGFVNFPVNISGVPVGVVSVLLNVTMSAAFTDNEVTITSAHIKIRREVTITVLEVLFIESPPLVLMETQSKISLLSFVCSSRYLKKLIDLLPGGRGSLRVVTNGPEFIECPWRQFGHVK